LSTFIQTISDFDCSWFAGVGEVDNVSVDLVITDASDGNRYPDIVKAWEDQGKDVPTNNGLNGSFGQINLQTVPKKPDSGLGEFLFCFEETGTNKKVTVKQYDLTLYDIDNRKVLREDLLIDTDQALNYKLSSSTELEVDCEDGSPTPCSPGVRTIFKATTEGKGSDNPKDPLNLTDKQKNRSVTFTFVNRSCVKIAYNHYCPGEKEGSMNCKKGQYAGGNFLFAGDSPLSTEPGECITKPPTEEPTGAPTNSPTNNPTSEPTAAPTGTPTVSPTTESPTVFPTFGPTAESSVSPSIAATNDPTASPSATPTAAPSVAATDSPSASPTATPTAATATPTAKPTLPDNPCPSDIELVKIEGNYPVDVQESVKIVEQNTDTVTVRLVNAFTSPEDTIDSIFYQYKEDEFNDKCYEAQDVSGGSAYEDITIQCLHATPVARLMICVADTGKNPLSSEDDAEVPQCCHPDLPEEADVVCYHMVVHCESTCVEETSRRRFLRG